MIEQQQIGSVQLSSQSQTQPSQEKHEQSPSETTEVVIEKELEENQEPVCSSTIIVEKSSSDCELIEGEISDSEKIEGESSDSEQLTGETSGSEQLTGETSDSEQLTGDSLDSEQQIAKESFDTEQQIAKESSDSEKVIAKETSSNEQEDKEEDKKEETENTDSVTDDNTKDPLNIEAAQLEISDILNKTSDINKQDSPLLTFVVDNNMESLTPLSIPSQEGTVNMPLKRLKYDVIHATGWDNNYPPHQLLPKDNNSSSNEGGIKYGKGWQSERRCTYPQEIILQVSCGAARIRRLQILSHHYKIATKLEIYVGSVQQRKEMVGKDTNTGSSHDEKKTLSWDNLPKIIENDGINSEDEDSSSDDTDYDIIKPNGEPYILFRRLGYCALDSNERANYKARELKSVRLDAEGEYIRLVARRCYSNNLNQHNQVGIVGITVMGEPADHLLAGESRKIPIENADEGLSRVDSPETCIIPDSYVNDQRNFTSLYSILPKSSLSVPNNNANNNQTKRNNPVTANDFLSNSEETKNLLAAFDRAKHAAVKVEDFSLAKTLKFCTELVKKASEDVLKYEEYKKRAVEEEDFDSADKYKQDIEAIRADIRGNLSDEGLDLDDSGEVIISDPSLQDIIGLADDVEVSRRCHFPRS